MLKKIICLLLSGILTAPVWAWPSKPVRIVVPLAPGGGNDLIARVVAKHLNDIWNQPVVVENRPGGQTTTGAASVAKSEPDGHTLLSAQPNILASSSLLVDNPNYNWERDLVPVAFMGAAPPFVLAVNSRTGIKNMSDLRRFAQDKKGVTYGSAGTGGPFHLYGALLSQSLGINGIHVPYKAAPPAVTDVVAGVVDMIFAPPAQILPYVQSGTLTAILVVGDRPLERFPGAVPAAGLNLRGFPNLHTNYALFAPAGVSDSVKQRLRQDIARAYELALPELVSRNLVDATVAVPAEFEQQARNDGRTWAQITRRVQGQ